MAQFVVAQLTVAQLTARSLLLRAAGGEGNALFQPAPSDQAPANKLARGLKGASGDTKVA